MLDSIRKRTWVERCRLTEAYHVSQLKSDSKWRIEDTAEALQRSIGSVSQDLLLASWLKTHENQLIRFKRMKDAIEFVRQHKFELRLRG